MNPIRNATLKASTLILALIMVSACSSSPVEEGQSALPAEGVAQGAPANTDAVPATGENTDLAQQPAPGSLDANPVAPPPAELPPAEAIPAVADNNIPSLDSQAPPADSAPESQEGLHYKVKRGDTLMKIAFENYGDLYRWKEIYEANRSKIQDPNSVPPGTVLILNGAGQVSIDRNGEQYLIKHGDTLGKISTGLYGTSKKWKRLWENNRQLVKDPNKIYAGFYLYYSSEGLLTHAQTQAPAANAAVAPQAPVANPVAPVNAVPAQPMAPPPVAIQAPPPGVPMSPPGMVPAPVDARAPASK